MKIKFSHWYDKLEGIKITKPVLLIQVLKFHYKDLSESMIEYDTHYLDMEGISNYYPLPKTDLILLIFMQGDRIFTTIRRYTKEKFEYYKELENQELNLDVETEE